MNILYARWILKYIRLSLTKCYTKFHGVLFLCTMKFSFQLYNKWALSSFRLIHPCLNLTHTERKNYNEKFQLIFHDPCANCGVNLYGVTFYRQAMHILWHSPVLFFTLLGPDGTHTYHLYLSPSLALTLLICSFCSSAFSFALRPNRVSSSFSLSNPQCSSLSSFIAGPRFPISTNSIANRWYAILPRLLIYQIDIPLQTMHQLLNTFMIK